MNLALHFWKEQSNEPVQLELDFEPKSSEFAHCGRILLRGFVCSDCGTRAYRPVGSSNVHPSCDFCRSYVLLDVSVYSDKQIHARPQGTPEEEMHWW